MSPLYPSNTETYDPLRHLAMALHSRDWREALFVVALTVVGDAGGSTVQPNEAGQVIGGFLANAGLWEDFDNAWRDFLARHDLKILHLNELSTDPKVRRPILDDAIQIITDHRYGLRCFTVLIDAEDFKLYQAEHKDDGYALGKGTESYPFAMLVHVADIDGYCRLNKLVQPKEFIYEAGDPYQWHLEKALEKRGFPRPIFRGKASGIFGLQAADFLCAEFLQGYRDGVIGDENRDPIRPQKTEVASPYLLAFMGMEGAQGIYTRHNMPKLKVAEQANARLAAAKEEGERTAKLSGA